MISKERVLRLFRRDPIDRMPVFSGQGMVVLPALRALNLRFSEVHLTAENLAASAIRTAEMFGFDSVVLPYDMCTIAEAAGLSVSLYHGSEEVLYPTLPEKWKTIEEVILPEDILQRGRMPIVSEAIRIAKARVGDRLAIGSWTLGPFTMAGQLVELDVLMKSTIRARAKVEDLLDRLAELLIRVGRHYRDLGVDYMSLREMGAGTDLLSPRVFRTLIVPRLQRILEAWDSPKILHICGATDLIIEAMNECGADGLSVDQKNDLAASRRKLGRDVLLLGNFDPYRTLCVVEADEVEGMIKDCVDRGADAVWPGCDIWPASKEENLRAYVSAVVKYGKGPTPAVKRIEA